MGNAFRAIRILTPPAMLGQTAKRAVQPRAQTRQASHGGIPLGRCGPRLFTCIVVGFVHLANPQEANKHVDRLGPRCETFQDHCDNDDWVRQSCASTCMKAGRGHGSEAPMDAPTSCDFAQIEILRPPPFNGRSNWDEPPADVSNYCQACILVISC